MSRKIAFRAWDKINKIMYKDIHKFDSFCEKLSRPNEYSIMQYTGLKDKNGKEIYEGDLLKVNDVNTVMEVKWYDDSAGFNLAYLNKNTCEVIGNIHENPELITQPQENKKRK